MKGSLRLFLDSLQMKFLTIRHYDVDYNYRLSHRPLPHSVLWYLREGRIVVHINQIRKEANAGDLILLPAGSVVVLHLLKDRASITSINFDAEIPFLANKPWQELLQLPNVFTQVNESTHSAILQIQSDASTGSVTQAMLLQGDFQRLIALLLAHHFRDESSHSPFQSADARIEALIEYMTIHKRQIPDTAVICSLLHLSPSYVRKLFLQQTGLSPLQFIHQFKLEQAKKLLLEDNKTIAAVADELGFAESNYFCRLFKKRTGYSPLLYRKKFQHWLSEPM